MDVFKMKFAANRLARQARAKLGEAGGGGEAGAGTGFADRFVQPEPEPEGEEEPEPEAEAESTRVKQVITVEALVALRQIIREYGEFQSTTAAAAEAENAELVKKGEDPKPMPRLELTGKKATRSFTVGTSEKVSKLLAEMFEEEWMAQRKKAMADTITVALLGQIADSWEAERAEWVAAHPPARKTGKWFNPLSWGGEESEEDRRKREVEEKADERRQARMARAKPKPPPTSPAEMAFIRLKIRVHRMINELTSGFLNRPPLPAAGAAPASLISFMATMCAEDFAFPSAGDAGCLLGSEAALIEPDLNQNRRTRNCSREKAVLLVLNFVVAKALVPELMTARNQSMRHLAGNPEQAAAEDRGRENLKMISTVVYWCCRQAMAAATLGSGMHVGDGPVLERLYSDGEQQHVLAELRRIEFIDDMAAKLLQVVDVVWDKAKVDS